MLPAVSWIRTTINMSPADLSPVNKLISGTHRPKGQKRRAAPLSWVEMAIETPAIMDRFADDVAASLGAWRKVSPLPIVTLLLAAGAAVTVPSRGNFAIFLVGLLLGFFSFGWLGTQFICYRRAFDGEPTHLKELLPLTWTFIARYVRLYFLALVPLVALVLVGILWHTYSAESPSWRIGVLAYVLVFNVAGTFINPTLAYSTRKVTKAVPLGLVMLAKGWPGNWKYAMVPSVAVAALGGTYWLLPSPGRPVLEVLITLISLMFAGAIARCYLRNPRRPGLD